LVSKEIRVQLDKEHWYKHEPKLVEINNESEVTISCDQQVQTDRTIHNNKPDIIIRDNEKETCMLIDVAISGEKNVINKIKKAKKISNLKRPYNRNTEHEQC
jgi:hypothetical protein